MMDEQVRRGLTADELQLANRLAAADEWTETEQQKAQMFLVMLLDERTTLLDENERLKSQVLDPDATCCADASRIHKGQRLEIERLNRALRNQQEIIDDTGNHWNDDDSLCPFNHNGACPVHSAQNPVPPEVIEAAINAISATRRESLAIEDVDRFFRELPTPTETASDCRKCARAVAVDSNWLEYSRRMFLCPTCGNKRCPKATDHELDEQ